MTTNRASVMSIEAVSRLAAALERFAAEVEDALIALELESRRPLEWIEHDRTPYWPREFRKASDRVNEARLALQRCELSATSDERRSCYEERVQLERARRRLRLCEEKIPVVQRWRARLRKEVEEFQTHAARMRNYLEADVPRAVAALGRMSAALDRYVSADGSTAVERPRRPDSGDASPGSSPEAAP